MGQRLSDKIRTGLLIHGRNLQARGWEEMMWGDPAASKLGTLPTVVLALLDEGPSNFEVIIFDSGGSRDEAGIAEAVVMKRLLESKFADLDSFSVIRDHPRWLAEKNSVKQLIAAAVVDTSTSKTSEEIARAAEIFTEHGVAKVIHVTGASHGPRCQQLQSIAREAGAISPGQRWRLITDDIPYPGTAAGDTLVLEEPHLLHDPLQHVDRELRPAYLFRQFYYVIPPGQRTAVLEKMAQLFSRYC